MAYWADQWFFRRLCGRMSALETGRKVTLSFELPISWSLAQSLGVAHLHAQTRALLLDGDGVLIWPAKQPRYYSRRQLQVADFLIS